MSVLSQILVALGGNASLLIVLGFLARSLVQTWLTKDVKRFEVDLQNAAFSQLERLRFDLKSQGDISIEQLKGRLQQAAVEHQVRFSRLHEKRAEAVEGLYQRASGLELEAARYASTLGRGGPERNGSEMYQQVVSKLHDFEAYRELHRIYLSDEIDELLCEFAAAVREPIVVIGVYGEFGSAPHEELRRYGEVILKAVQATTERVPKVRSALIKEFRAILSGM